MSQQQLSPGSETIVSERPEYRYDDGDADRFSHYVPKDKLTEAMVMGTPVVALCGKVWVPNRDPQRFPVCPECKEIWESFGSGGDDNDGSQDGGSQDGGDSDGGGEGGSDES